MYDTDTAQLLFFGNQFRLVNDALEDFLENEGLSMHHLFNDEQLYGFVVVHAESNYLVSLKAGDAITISVTVTHIGTTSFAFEYVLTRNADNLVVGTSKTSHVVIQKKTHQKMAIPDVLKEILKRHQV